MFERVIVLLCDGDSKIGLQIIFLVSERQSVGHIGRGESIRNQCASSISSGPIRARSVGISCARLGFCAREPRF